MKQPKNSSAMYQNRDSKINTKNMLKFILGSALGIGMFLVPFPEGNSFTTGITELTDLVKSVLKPVLNWMLLAIMIVTAGMSLLEFFVKPQFIEKRLMLKKMFSTSLIYLLTKILSVVIVVMVLFQVGPEQVLSADTGASMISLAGSLIAIVFSLSFIMPFLTDCGIMEFLGVIARPVVRPLFKVPGRASIDLIASWFGASNAAVILTREQYNGGFYSGREAAVIMTDFSIVSIPFCLMVAETIGLTDVFPTFYLIICLVGIMLAIIMTRIPPLSKLPDTYNEEIGKRIKEDVPEKMSTLKWALEQSCTRSETFGVSNVVHGGMAVLTSMFFDLIPIVVTWGTISLIVVQYTPIFTWISYPMGWMMQLLGLEEAFAAAPATLVGFVDMFIPAILLTGITSIKTKFVIGILSLVQIIYLTEVGAIIIKSKVPLGFKEILIIFLERTIIALPVIVLFTNLLL